MPRTNSPNTTVLSLRLMKLIAHLPPLTGHRRQIEGYHGAADDSHGGQGNRQEHLPTEAHQLIVAVTGKGRPHPQENEQHCRDLEREPHRPRYQGKSKTVA